MANIQHQALGYSEVHVPFSYSYANSTAREGDSGFVSGDIGKLALQTDNNTLWMLTATTPTWAAAILAGSITVDTILEDTPGVGVTIDGVLCKDSAVTATGGFVGDVTGAVTGVVTGSLDGNVRSINSTIVLNSGTDGTDATFIGDITGTLNTYDTGNASGDIPVNNGTVNTNLDADLLDGNHATAFSGIAHTHGQSGIAARAIGQGECKTATGTVSLAVSGGGSSSALKTTAGGEYGFYPRSWVSTSSFIGALFNGGNFNNTSALTQIHLFGDSASGNGTVYASQRYFQASPPYKIGNISWGHFLFILRNISTGEVLGSYEAQDPPWAYNGPAHNKKDSKERIIATPHPFGNFNIDNGPMIDATNSIALEAAGFEVCLVNLQEFDEKIWRTYPSNKNKSSILEDLSNVLPTGGTKQTRVSIGVPEISGFTDKIKFIKA